MQVGDVSLEKVNTSLYRFAGEVVHSRGMISLPLTMGEGATRKTYMLKFLVVDVPSAYNVILGRPTLNAFQVVISIYHMKIKFPTPGGVGKKGKEAVAEGAPEEVEVPTRVQLELLNIKITLSSPDKTTRIGSQLEAENQGRNNSMFTAQCRYLHMGTSRFRGNRPKVITHHLNIDPAIKPVKQKKRHFEPEKDKIIQAEVDMLMAAGKIQFLEWLSNVVLVSKPGRKWRMCVDFRDLNKACPKDFRDLNGSCPIEKMALALVVTARRLLPYFLWHPIAVKTNTPLKQTL
ncbi:UNVERIFIED_CONTAM: hypothetical protein Sradi_5727700 [Sesamum radiatum]|uniref:Uncharacterized protein n=1 Tax=Sesamum radiatum TaxID=300843 RepID=A0AAW2L3W5_SESRA